MKYQQILIVTKNNCKVVHSKYPVFSILSFFFLHDIGNFEKTTLIFMC